MLPGLAAEYNDCQDKYPGNILGDSAAHIMSALSLCHGWNSCVFTLYTHSDIVELFDEHGGSSPPPILDLNQTKLPGRCRMGQVKHVCTAHPPE